MSEAENKGNDLILIEKLKDNATLIKEYNEELSQWKNNLNAMQEYYFEQHKDLTSSNVKELLAMRKLLGGFIQIRLDWITNAVLDESLRSRYLHIIPPFPQKDGIKKMLLHFFQADGTDDQTNIVYEEKDHVERELCILWDVYKLRKTIESIDTIRKSLSKGQLFRTILSKRKQIDGLTSLKKVFNVMFQMIIRKEHRQALYSGLNSDILNPEKIKAQQAKDQSYVYPQVIQNYNYRNHFFYAFYSPSMKIKVANQMQTLYYNYLDLEIIKQEFLIDWLINRVGASNQKSEIYAKYGLEGKTLDDVIKAKPIKEGDILKELPLAVFNDIAAQVNESVGKAIKTKVDSQSDNHGEFSRVAKEFGKAQQFARESFRKLKSLLKKKDVKAAPDRKVIRSKELETKPAQEKSVFEFHPLSKEQIDNPFFNIDDRASMSRLASFRSRMGPVYTEFNKELGDRFSVMPESASIVRRTPTHEVIYPQVITETIGKKTINHLLILGAQAKAKQLSMTYQAPGSESTHGFRCFFLYGTDKPDSSLGEIVETRTAKGIQFQMYDILTQETRSKALTFYNLVKDQMPARGKP